MGRAAATSVRGEFIQWWERTPAARAPDRAQTLTVGRKKMTSWTHRFGADQAFIVGVNAEGTPYDNNCGYCALEVDKRLGGGPPSGETTYALPALTLSQLSTILGVPFVGIDTPSIAAVADIIPPGHRAIVGIWNNNQWAHAFNIAHHRRGVTIYDGKLGLIGIDPEAYQVMMGFPDAVEVGLWLTSDWRKLPDGHPLRDALEPNHAGGLGL